MSGRFITVNGKRKYIGKSADKEKADRHKQFDYSSRGAKTSWAALFPFLLAPSTEKFLVQDKDKKVCEIWQGRVNSLAELDWKELTKRANRIDKLLSCPSIFSVRNDKATEYCNSYPCPLCWQRRVIYQHNNLSRIFSHVSRADVIIGNVNDVSYLPSSVNDRDNLFDAYSRTAADRWGELHYSYPKWQGARSLFTVEPAEVDSIQHWKLHYRLLFLFDKGIDLSPYPHVHCMHSPTLEDVSRAVAKFAEYPAGLMLGDVNMAKCVLEVRADGKYRTEASYGRFRNKS